MPRRFGWSLPLVLAGLLAQTGCVSMPLWDNDSGKKIDDQAGKAVTTLPPAKSAELCLKLAAKFERNGNLGEAAAQYELARHYDPNLKDVDHRLAILYDEMGKLQLALEECEKKLAARPNDADLLNDVGSFHYDLGSWSQAEKYFRQALTVNSKHERACINLGLTLGQEERYQESLEAFLKVLRPAEAECNLAFVLLTQGKRADAREAYRRALNQDPSSQIARAVLAKLDQAGDVPDLKRTSAKPSGDQK